MRITWGKYRMDKIKIAYLIIAYMDPKQLARLAKRLTNTADVYIHINANEEIGPFSKYLNRLHEKGKVTLLKKRYHVQWGGYSILKATFALLEEALGHYRYDRFVLLTGLDYPIKSDVVIQNFFDKHRQTEYIHASLVKGAFKSYVCRDHEKINEILIKLEKAGILINRRGKTDKIIYKNKEYAVYGCAPKWALTGEAAIYLLHFWKLNKGFNRQFCFMHAPDDFYVATVLFHSRFRKDIEAEKDIFKIIWTQNKGAKILTENDYAELSECDQLYAKKFQSNYFSVKLLQRLENGFRKESQRTSDENQGGTYV